VARLRVTRPYDGGGILRRLRVEIDGREVAVLKQYRSVDLPVPPGRHTVVGRMDWAGSASLTVDLAEDEELHLELALPLMPMWDRMQRSPRALSIRRL
jgi:hypothetical protein